MKPIAYVLAILLFAVGATEATAQQRVITGTITGSDGRPVPLALVEVVGAPRAANADQEGRFTLQAPPGEVTLRVTSIGYRVRDVVVPAGQNTVSVELETDALELEGIVVTGQATSVARRNLANAVSTVSPSEIADAAPAQSPEEIFQGRLAGALVERNSGAPGGGIQVRLRGASTLIGESEPLYVVDGVAMSNASVSSDLGSLVSRTDPGEDGPVNRIADLNPHEIERIEVLKGASAAALYGSRAANGVIIITTRQGTPGVTRVNVSQRFGVYQRSNSLPFRRWTRDDAVDFFELSETEANRWFRADGSPILVQDHEELLADRGDLSLETTASVSGGDEDTRYFASGTWRSDEGIIERTGYEKQSVRLNLEQTVSDRISLNLNTNLIRTVTDRTITNNENQGTSLYMVLPFTPTFVDLTANPDGTFPDNPFERSNPLETVRLVDNEEEVYRFVAGLTASFDALETDRSRLGFTSTLGVDYFNQENDILFPTQLEFEDDDDLLGTSAITSADNVDLTWTANGVFEFARPGLRSTTTAGVQFEDRELNILRNSAEGLTAGQPNIDQGVVTTIDEDRERVKDFGVFAQEEVLLFDERLFLTAGVRADRSSVNADGEEYFVYPKASGSYRFDNVTSWLDGLKLRAAWGQSGNQPLYGQKFTPLNTGVNVEGIPGAIIGGTVGAVDLKPEQQEEIEFGVDLTLLAGRAQITATYFQKTITDLLLERQPAPSSGFDSEVFNGGEMETDGYELTLDAVPLQTDDFSWISRTTFYHDESTVTDLPVPSFETDAGFGATFGAIRIEEGQSPTAIVANAGRDEDGDQIVDKLGDVNPDFRMGFTNDFDVLGFRIHSLFEWSQGQDVINLTQLLGDFQQNWEDWTIPTEDGSTTIGARRLGRWADDDFGGYVQDGSYVKLRELSVAYQLPQNVLGSGPLSRFSSVRIVLSGRNLVTWTDYEGLDPEVSNFSNQPLARNFDVAPFPPSRSFWLGFDFGL